MSFATPVAAGALVPLPVTSSHQSGPTTPSIHDTTLECQNLIDLDIMDDEPQPPNKSAFHNQVSTSRDTKLKIVIPPDRTATITQPRSILDWPQEVVLGEHPVLGAQAAGNAKASSPGQAADSSDGQMPCAAVNTDPSSTVEPVTQDHLIDSDESLSVGQRSDTFNTPSSLGCPIDELAIIPPIDLATTELLEIDISHSQEQTLETDHVSFFEAAMSFLRREIEINELADPLAVPEAPDKVSTSQLIDSHKPQPEPEPETQDLIDDSIHETQNAVAESDGREFHSTMNQQCPRPADANEEDKVRARAEAKARHQNRQKDVWGFTIFQRVRGCSNVAQAILAPTFTPAPGEPELLSSKHGKGGTISSDRAKTVFHMLEPVLGTARSFPGRLTLEIQLGLLLLPPMQRTGSMDLAGLRNCFHPQTGLPAPNTFFNNHLGTSKGDINLVVGAEVNGHRIFYKKAFDDSHDFEFHCTLREGNVTDSFIVTIFGDDHIRTARKEHTLANISLNYPDSVWDAAIVLSGQSSYVKMRAGIEQDIQYMVENFRRHFTSFDIHVETTISPRSFEVKQIIMKEISKHRYLRQTEQGGKEDLYLRITEVHDLIISLSGSDKTIIEAHCPSIPKKDERNRYWWEASLISSAAEEGLESNWKLELGSQTGKWNTATLFGQGMAPASASTSNSPDSLIDAPGLWSLFGLAEIVVKNIDDVGSVSPSKNDTSDHLGGEEVSNALVLSERPPIGPSSSTTRPGSDENSRNIVSRTNSSRQKPDSERYW